jgi:tetratricopeptide (TPR) repeat protein
MKDHEHQLPEAVHTSLQKCFAKIRLVRATELAQAGLWQQAQMLLEECGDAPRTAAELDLLARITAQQGRFDLARKYWNAAIQIEPANKIYHECLAHLTPTRRVLTIIAYYQDSLLHVLMWVTIIFGIVVLIYTA